MYEDLTHNPSKETLKEKIKELQDTLIETKDWMLDKQNECDVLKNLYNDAFNDSKRFAQKISEIYQRINENDLQDDFSDLDIEGLVNEKH